MSRATGARVGGPPPEGVDVGYPLLPPGRARPDTTPVHTASPRVSRGKDAVVEEQVHCARRDGRRSWASGGGGDSGRELLEAGAIGWRDPGIGM